VVLYNGIFLELGDGPTRSDRDIVFRAIRSNPEALQFASPGLRLNREVVLTAIRRKGVVLRYAHEKLKNDPELVFEAVREDPDALQFASDEIRQNKDLVILAARYKPSAVKFAKGGLERDEHVQKAAGTWRGFHDTSEEKPPKLPVILSLARSSGTRTTTKLGMDFQTALSNHWFLSDMTDAQDPNSWQQGFCGRSSCIGSLETCGDPAEIGNNANKNPKDAKFRCWRMSVAYKISQCAKAGGAMFQVEEDGCLTPEQEMQVEMARHAHLKVFRARARKGQRCTADTLWRLGCAVRVWHQDNSKSVRTEIVDMH